MPDTLPFNQLDMLAANRNAGQFFEQDFSHIRWHEKL
jgi:hypothetical protein